MNKEIRITNGIMFAKVMEDESICKELLERIFPEKKVESVIVTEKVDLSIEKTFIPGLDAKKIRLDVVFENEKEIYDIEMQVENREFLPKRMRYYSGAMDVNSLKAGEPYKKLKSNYVIFICNFDFFGMDEPIYKFENVDKEKGLQLGDDSYKIVVNTTCNNTKVSDELKSFFEYVHLGVVNSDDNLINRMELKVRELSERKDVKTAMTLYDEMEMQKNIAKEDGYIEALQEIAKKFKEDGIDLKLIAKNTGLTLEEIEKL